MERDGMEKKRLILETFFKTGEAEVNDSSTVGGPMFSLPSLFFLAFGIWALISRLGIQPVPPCSGKPESQPLNHQGSPLETFGRSKTEW